MRKKPDISLFDWRVTGPALKVAFAKLDPRLMARNPVMFVTEIVAALSTLLFLRDLFAGGENLAISGQIAAWLWFTVYFANVAEAMAEGRGKARADTLRATQSETPARKLASIDAEAPETVSSRSLRPGDLVLVKVDDIVPADGEIVEGIASVDESAITGESAPVIREAGGDRSAVTGGTRVVSDWIKVKITSKPGESFLDRMIAMVEGAERQKTPNEIALNILLAGMTIIFLIVVVTLQPFVMYSGAFVPVVFLIALLVTLITTSTCCCSTRRARSPSEHARPTPSSPCRASRRRRWRKPRCWHRSPTRRPKAARLSISRESIWAGSSTERTR
jgi:K+-transporting ATPase ATPase B chain